MRHLIVMPAYNEEGTLAASIADLQCLSDHFDILVVNDGSKDQTQQCAETAARASRLPVHVVQLPVNCGIGVAVQTGYIYARRKGLYQYVIQFDADGQHDARDVPKLIEECDDKQLDVCIGSRFLDPSTEGFRSSFQRRLGIRFFTWLIRIMTGVHATDPTSGLRCAGPRAWTRFARFYPEDYPEPEAIFWCARNRLRVGEIAVTMRARQEGVSSIRGFQSFYYMLKVTLALFFDRLRRKEHA